MNDPEVGDVLYAWVAETPDGKTVLIGTDIQGLHMPMIGHDKALMMEVEAVARSYHHATGWPVWLREYHQRVDHDVLE